MNNKELYYTPKIEELCLGFECEIFHETKNKWIQHIIDIDSIKELQYLYPRVKYLDKEDIESFGFKRPTEDILYFIKDTIHIWNPYSNDLDKIVIQDLKDTITIGKELHFRQCRFQGIIKNKSELKKLLIQIGIIEND